MLGFDAEPSIASSFCAATIAIRPSTEDDSCAVAAARLAFEKGSDAGRPDLGGCPLAGHISFLFFKERR
jgi:hypothetical protein